MSQTASDTLSRLRAADPFPVQPDLGRGPTAQAGLERILNDSAPAPARPRLWSRVRLTRGGLGVAVAVMCLGGGAAIAATNPFGWWSSSPASADYGIDPSIHVRTPTEDQVTCHAGGSAFVCASGGSGQRYERIDSVQLPGRLSVLTRAGMTRAIARAEANHQISKAHAARALADLARVPDSFFPKLRLAFHYATLSDGNGRVPPPGVPEFLVCQDAGSSLSCQNLNGDSRAPVGAGIYGAEPAPDWRPAPKGHRYYSQLPPGISFTPAEDRVLYDIVLSVTATSASGSHGQLGGSKAGG